MIRRRRRPAPVVLPDPIDWKAASKSGIVAAGDRKTVSIGIEVLARNGNAADAAVAVILALTVTDHGACSIGGEVPVLIFDAEKQEVKALCGQGRAPLSQTATDWFMENGMPAGGDIRVAPVPSVVDLCITTLKQYGTMTLKEVVTPTLAILDAGKEDWHPRLAVTLRRMVEEEQITTGSRAEKLQAATDRFYGRNRFRNDIADDLEASYIDQGGFLRKADLAAHVTLIEDPVTVNYRGYTVCKCGPWTQGPFLCQALRLLEGFDLRAMGHFSADYVHVVTEAIKLAMADRDEYYGDPAFVDVPLSVLLSDAYTRIRRPLIDMQKASLEARPGDPRHLKSLKGQGVFRPGTCGTSTCVVADRWGNVVCAAPSANVFLEKLDGGRAGVTYGNRLRSFNTDPDHPNCIQAGKRPRITPSPTMVLKNGRPVLALSVAGGDLQDQTTLNLLLHFIEFGATPEAAVTAPRFATTHHQNSFDPNSNRASTFIRAGSLTISDSVSHTVQKELAGRGHQVEATASPIATPVMVYIDQDAGMFYAAGDPAVHRHAAGLRGQNPAVSVVIPTYNRAALIGRSIQSVLNQSYQDFEVLLIDDGSTDETAGVVSGFRDERITYVPLAHNIGAGAARNVGIRMSKAKFVAFQDSDDEWFPEKLAKQMSIFERGPSTLGVVYSDKQRILKDGTVKYHPAPAAVSGQLVNPDIKFYQPFKLGIQSSLIRRECFETAGYFNEDLPAFEDLELFIRLSRSCDFCHIPEPLVKYHETKGLSNDPYASWVARRLIVKLYLGELLFHNPAFLFKECVWLSTNRRWAMRAKRMKAVERSAE